MVSQDYTKTMEVQRKLRSAVPTQPLRPLQGTGSIRTEPIDVTPYLGRLWDDKTWNCWQLVCTVYQEVFDIPLPDYSGIHPDDGGKVALAFMRQKPLWYQVAKRPEVVQRVPIGSPGDVVTFKISLPRKLRYHENHVGVIVEPGRFLHVRRGTATTAPSLQDPEWRGRVDALYRHPNLLAITL